MSGDTDRAVEAGLRSALDRLEAAIDGSQWVTAGNRLRELRAVLSGSPGSDTALDVDPKGHALNCASRYIGYRCDCAVAMAGHRSEDIHDCFALNCRALGREVRDLLARLSSPTPEREQG